MNQNEIDAIKRRTRPLNLTIPSVPSKPSNGPIASAKEMSNHMRHFTIETSHYKDTFEGLLALLAETDFTDDEIEAVAKLKPGEHFNLLDTNGSLFATIARIA